MGWLTGRNGRLTILGTLATAGVIMVTPANGAAIGLVQRISHAVRHLVSGPHQAAQSTAMQRASRSFDGTAAVGALFALSGGKITTHFCSASVVHSPHGDLVITAAHCVASSDPSTMAFVPDYNNGQSPYGVWPVKHIYTDDAWRSSSAPDDDVAFLTLSSPETPIEDVTGGEQLATGLSAPAAVTVIGYPDGAGSPVTCRNWAKSMSPTQLEFDCAGFANGTSGGPFLTDISAVSGQGTIVGIIGGYQQGGDTADVSYSPVLGSNVAALYSQAVAGG